MAIAIWLLFSTHHHAENFIEKRVALAATAMFSLNASAGYVHYDFEATVFEYFVQHDDDKIMADYSLMVIDPITPTIARSFLLQEFSITSLAQARLLPAPVP